MKLVELHPAWMKGHPDREGVGVVFDCPGPCCAAKPAPDGERDPEEGRSKKMRLHVQFAVALDGLPWNGSEPRWDRTGDTFEALTLRPSVDASGFGHWHGFITNGEAR